MIDRRFAGLFIAEGTSDLPLSDLVELLFFDCGLRLDLSRPDFSMLAKVPKDSASRIRAGRQLVGRPLDVIVVHRDADRAGSEARREELAAAMSQAGAPEVMVPVVPVRMTEAWLLLDEEAVRFVAGNPRGRTKLRLPKAHEVESVADPKQLLRECLLTAAEASGRRRERVAQRFEQNRRQLLENLDRSGPVGQLRSWKQMVSDVQQAASVLLG
jgi:hypothetical protein